MSVPLGGLRGLTVSLSHFLRHNRSRRIATGSGTTAIRRRLRIRTGLGATAAAILLIVAAGIGATRNGGRTEPKTTTAAQEIRIDSQLDTPQPGDSLHLLQALDPGVALDHPDDVGIAVAPVGA